MADISKVHDLGKQYGFNDQMMGWISDAASNNRAMHEYTPEKQAVYDAYQGYLKGQIYENAQAQAGLHDPTQWKQDLYDQYSQGSGGGGGGGGGGGFSYSDGDSRMASMQEWMQQQAQAQIEQQRAQLSAARDSELLALQKALNDAVSRGEMSIKQAEQQYLSAKDQIHRQGYQDAEYTNLVSQQRGIANSMQSIGLTQGDQSRTNSLLNQNLTTRDQQINSINNQLDGIRSNNALDMVNANSKFEYAMANAQGGINADMFGRMADYSFQDHQAKQGFEFQSSLMGQQHQYDMSKMSQTQVYQLEQMAKNFGYDLQKMSQQQINQLAQMGAGFGYDLALQQGNQNFQGSQADKDRQFQTQMQQMKQKHDFSMLGAEFQQQLAQYDIELQRKLNLYTPGTSEYNLLTSEADWAYGQASRENLVNMMSEIGHTQLAGLLAMYPTEYPDRSNASAVEAYNKQVESINKQIERVINDPSAQQYLRDLEVASGKNTSGSGNGTGGFLGLLRKAIQTTPIVSVPSSVWNGVKGLTSTP